ncbi:MAG: amino acid ABC transporter permease [Rhodospirillaceae bacterium]|mgnify:CR=1 FL=1|jgi:general L-amino acid transport system permease protein|nr:amino acid ABC transporter permease [Rhodospirillaceae bacterium]
MSDQADKAGTTVAKPPPWNDPFVRSIFFQVVAIGLLGYFFYSIFDNTLSNMAKSGVSTGFAFLTREAGFGILMSLIEYDETHTYGRTFFVGLLNTAIVAFCGIILATILGFVIGIARLSNNWLVSKLATVYIEIIRNIPLLLQIIFWSVAVLQALPDPQNSIKYGESFFLNNRGLFLPKPIFEDGFGLVTIAFLVAIAAIVYIKRWARQRQEQSGDQFPVFLTSVALITGLPLLVFLAMGMPISWEYSALERFSFVGGSNIIPEFMALLWALTMYTAAFIAEIVRSGIQAVSHGQTEAARALGLRNGPTLRLVIIPQAMRVIIPPLTSQYLNLTKNSSLATAIGYPDLVSVFMGTTLNQTGQAVEIVAMTMAVYLTFSLGISAIMNWYNKRVALVER